MFGNPIFGKMSDRTSSPFGMRRPWMVIGLVGGSLGILIVALAPNITILLVGWCIAQLLFNALLAAVVAVLPDQVPIGQRGLISGILGVGMPIASVSATFLVKLFTGNQLAMFLAPCAIGGFFVILFIINIKKTILVLSHWLVLHNNRKFLKRMGAHHQRLHQLQKVLPNLSREHARLCFTSGMHGDLRDSAEYLCDKKLPWFGQTSSPSTSFDS